MAAAHAEAFKMQKHKIAVALSQQHLFAGVAASPAPAEKLKSAGKHSLDMTKSKLKPEALLRNVTASTAATSARLRVVMPRLLTPVLGPPLLSRIIENVARKPPTVHTMVETVRGLMPARRDRLGLSADAVTALPKAVSYTHLTLPTMELV